MATSSITDNVVISDPDQVKAFADAVEAAFENPLSHKQASVRMITDKDELVKLMERRRMMHG